MSYRTLKVLVGVALACAVSLAGQGLDSTAQAQAVPVDYDIDQDGLIEVTTVDQLNAIRWDPNGDGLPDLSADAASYAEAFPDAMTSPRMGCTHGCTGYELYSNLDLAGAGSIFLGWEPIGNSDNEYNAIFDGGAPAYTISNLYIARRGQGEDEVGLFGQTGSSSVIRNVTLVSVNVTGDDSTGALVGKNGGSISNASVAGTLEGDNYVGGLVGTNAGPIRNCRVSGGTVRGDSWVGGLVGLNSSASRGANPISGSAVSADVTATGSRVGGLVGQNLTGSISDSHASGDVVGVQWVGGLVGSNYDVVAWNTTSVGVNAIRWSTASGEVTGSGNTVGGLAGFNNGPISDSDALGSMVTGGQTWVGGLVGSNNDSDGTATIVRSTASANVTARATDGLNTGGLVGWNNSDITDSYARGDVRGHTQLGGLVGWNSSDITDSSAMGAVGDPTSIGEMVGGLVGLHKGGTISGSVARGEVRTSGSPVGGLVGRSEGSITESVATGAVTGARTAGGLVGFQRNTGAIAGSYASGSATSIGDRAGGLVGWNAGLIRGSYATGVVGGVNNVGGLVGDLAGKVVASYSSGRVIGSGVGVGGLIGCARSAGPISSDSRVGASYATGAVSGSAGMTGGLVGIAEPAYESEGVVRAGAGFHSSYWDTQRSGQSVGIGSQALRCSGLPPNGAIETVTYGVVGQTTAALRTPTGYTGIYTTWNIDTDDGDTAVAAGSQPWHFGGSSDDPRLRGPSNPPTFSTSTLTRTVAEGEGLGVAMGSPITASDSDRDTLTYSLVGAGGRNFDVDSATGQLQVGAVLDAETGDTFTVTVQASDGKTVAFKDVEVTVTNENEPPSFATANTTRSVAENVSSGTAIGTPVAAVDPDSVSLTYTLEGPDAAAFSIATSTGQLLTSAALDYEYRNSYAVVVRASDGLDSALIDVTISLSDGDDAGELRLSSLQPQVGTALTPTLTDPDGSVSATAWEWSSGTPLTPIAGAVARAYTPTAANAGQDLQVKVTYSDAFGSAKVVEHGSRSRVRAAPTTINSAPSFAAGTVTRSVSEDTASGTDIGAAVAATDSDSSDTLTYSLTGSDAAFFDIVPATGQLSTKVALDTETKASYSVIVVATDPSLDSASKAVAITVTSVDESPVVSGAREVDYAEGGSNPVATYAARDPESSTTAITWSLAGADSDAFTITNGALSFSAPPDFESPTDAGRDNVYHVTVQASDDSTSPNTGSLNVTVTVIDADEAPALSGPATATYPENSYGAVAVYTATDPERAPISWSLAGSDSGDFEISSNGRLRRLSRTPRDYEFPTGSSGNTYTVTVRAADGTRTASQAVTVNVTDVDEQPVLSGPAEQAYDENTTGPVGTYRYADPEGATPTWEELGGPDAAMFELVNHVLSFRTSPTFTSPDFEDPMDDGGDNVYQVTLQASDTTTPTPNTGARDVVVTVINVDEAGEVTLNTLQPRIGTEILATLSDDDGGATDIAWQWKRDGVNISRARGTSDRYTPTRGGVGNPTIPSDLSALLTAAVTYTDAHGANKTAEVTTANRVTTELPGSRPPLFPISETGERTVDENTRAKEPIGDPVAATDEDVADPNIDDVIIYLLSGPDETSFAIDEGTGQLRTEDPLNHESKDSYSVTVTARDSTGLSATQSVEISVTDVNEPPVLTEGVAEINYAESGTVAVETYAAIDPDGTAITWSLAGTDRAAFTIVGGELRFTDPPNFEGKRTYRVTVRASDGEPGEPDTLTDSMLVTINVLDVNERPEVTSGESDVGYPENSTGTVQTYTARDPEGSTVIWSLSGTDNEAFTFTGGVLRFTAPPDYEQESTYRVTVQASDGEPGEPGTLTTDLPVTIDVENVNEGGELALSLLQPQVGTPQVASLDDEDIVRGAITWQWFSGAAEISGANSDSYTPVDSDVSNLLRVTASYDDGAASGNTAEVTSARTVRARPPSNAAPLFPAAETGARDVGQNMGPGQAFGARVVATDTDDDVLTYSLEQSGDWESFRIDEATGQLLTATAIEGAVGETYSIVVTATDPSGETATQTVTVTVTDPPPVVITGVGGGGVGGGDGPSPSTVDFEWTVKHDIEALDSGHDTPSGMWSDGTTLWLLDNPGSAGDAAHAYDLESGERVEEHEFELHRTNRAPRGVWSDRETVWVSDSGQNLLFAYDRVSGQRDEEREIVLAERNRDARGIWSDGTTMWVLDGGKNSLFAYDLATGELLAEYALDAANDDPRGVWSDGVTVWVSDHATKRLLAYRLPMLPGEDDPSGEDRALERVSDEDFRELSAASNNSPRGIWSDGDVMYVADESDDRVYSYNMPDAIDARLASLSLEGIEIGEFDPGQTEYEGVPDEGVIETTVEAAAMQRRTDVDIDPPDADEAAEGHQVALGGLAAITVTVTSADGSREKTYRVAFGEAEQEAVPEAWAHCLRGDIAEGFSLLLHEGGTVGELAACAESRSVAALYSLHEGVYVSFVLGAPDFVNERFREFYAAGVPALTPLIAASTGPPSSDPVGDIGVPPFWPDCLRGDVVEGFSLVIYQGGSVEELESCAGSRGVTAVYALAGGEWRSYILGAPEFVNQPFRQLFPDGLPTLTPLAAKGEDRPAIGADGDGTAGN